MKTQIDEDHATVIAPPVDPAADADFLIDVAFVEFAAVMGTHAVGFPGGWSGTALPYIRSMRD